MSHLGRRLSALIDGELGDAERDQAHAHLVSCDACREEAVALRTLKRRMRGLGETPADGALTRRLIALEGMVQATQPRPSRAARERSAFAASSSTGPAASPPDWDSVFNWLGEPAAMTPATSPLGGPPPAASRGRVHPRYVVAGAVAAIAVGLGAASFAAGGDRLPGPTVTPEVDVYNAQHAEITGEIPPFLPGAGGQSRRTSPARRTSDQAGQTLHQAGRTALLGP